MPENIKPYDRSAAVQYAHQWAHARNPAYYNFDSIEGTAPALPPSASMPGRG